MRRGFSANIVGQLVEDGLITEENMDHVRKIREERGGKLEDIIVEEGFVDADDMLSYRALALETVPIHLENLMIPQEVLALVPEDVAGKYRLVPIFRTSTVLTVAMANPLDINTIDDIERMTRLRVVPMISNQREIKEAINRLYRSSSEVVGGYLKKIQPNGQKLETVYENMESSAPDYENLEQLAEDAPIIGLVDVIIRQAIEDQASDIHIEAYQDRVRVRFRVDGVLREVESPPKNIHPGIVARIKIISNMDIGERRRPQDGRMKIKMPNKTITLRVSSLPTAFGEKIVMRIADESKTMFTLNELGMPSGVLEKYTQALESPRGMILVTGPTGSGKTSTLYASLNRINKPEVNIVSIEDPIEYLISGLNQVEINVKAGRTFPILLRSIVRQDPDIIMIGEIRDFETAELGVEAALTGHLVFSTVHTNDAPSTISRLLDLDVEPFLISASVTCIIAQRLVRLLCPNCRKAYKPKPELIERLKLPAEDYTFYEKGGCPICGNTGYKGRTGVYETMFVDNEIRELTALKADVRDIQEAAIKNGMVTLRKAAIDRVIEGVTSVEEAFRATAE